jgi:hypothetical protein
LPDKIRDVLGDLAALALGVVAFFALIGWPTLVVTNIGWLNFADRAMHTLGWFFFRQAPWGNPPGLNPHLGIELANSIGLVDGLPLFALPAKLLAQWLPQPFQYWGLWLLVSFLLQAFFAYRIARALDAGRLVSLCAVVFVLITPALMFRVMMHLALSGHWTVLAALYLYVRRAPPSRWMWPLLVAVTAGIHAYLLAMVLGLWIAAFWQRLWLERMRWRDAVLELVLGVVAAMIVLWAGGFFTSGTTGTYGLGSYKLNLLGPILPYKGWSQLIPDLPHTRYDYEGLSFLGIGILALLVIAIFSGAVARLRSAVAKRWLPLLILLVLMAIFAVSQKPALGPIELFTIPLPKSLETLASTFRSTGRFVWPLLYTATIVIVVLIGRRFRLAIALTLILIALGAQLADSGPQLLSFSRYLGPVTTTWDTELKSQFWKRAAAAGYNRVRAIPIIQPGKDWQALGYYAVTHGMDIDSVYLGRTSDRELNALRDRERIVLETGDFEPRTLYELDDRAAAQAALHLETGDLLAVIDHRIVFARGGANLVDGLGIDPLSATMH